MCGWREERTRVFARMSFSLGPISVDTSRADEPNIVNRYVLGIKWFGDDEVWEVELEFTLGFEHWGSVVFG